MDNRTSAIHLPRQVVVQLLHTAQCAGEKPVGGVIITTVENQWRVHSLPLDSDGLPDATALQQLIANSDDGGKRLFACYRTAESMSERPATPANRIFHGIPQLLIYLGTRGVLEIQGWYPFPDGYQPVAIGMHEEGQ